MKKLLVPFCLTLIIFIGSAGVSESADFQKGLNALQKKDYATALREWKPLAEQGHAPAQSGLGMMYFQGTGVSKDYKTAAKWYRLAAEQGNASAQSSLGLMYALGDGVAADYMPAYMWLKIAASSENKFAIKNMDAIAKRMTPADISIAQKLARECVRKKYKGC